MKNLLFSVFAVFAIGGLYAQNSWCGADYIETQFLNEASAEEIRQYEYNLSHAAQNAISSAESNDSLIIVPVVIHMLHDDCVGNISNAQIQDGLRVVNEDFRRMNSDSSSTRSLFKPYAGDAKIEFRLATIDKNGNCFDGIVKYNTTDTYNANDDMKAGRIWNIRKYLNVWLVESIDLGDGAGTLGYAFLPSYNFNFLQNRYGLVVRNDAWGTIGTSSSDGRTATHELGHALDLLHTFRHRGNDGCGSTCQNSGDYVCDTPPQYEPYWNCSSSLNTCSNDASGGTIDNPNPYSSNVVDQIENYMSYNSCQNMYSLGQIVRMRSAFQTTFLSNLITPANLLATGVDPNMTLSQCKPLPDFCQDLTIICANSTVTYTDRTYRGIETTRNWSFPGGIPATSTDSIVTVSYENAGTFNVSLTVGNSSGSATENRPAVIVEPAEAKFSNWRYEEDFENNTAFDTNWTVVNSSGGRAWERTNLASVSGENSVFINNYTNGLDMVDELISPSYDLSSVISPRLSYKVAYARKNSNSLDILKIFYSYDCGNNWTFVGIRAGQLLESVSDFRTSQFYPASGEEWKTEQFKLSSIVSDKKNVLIKFEFLSGGGNNIFIDDINIESTTGIEDAENLESIRLYPNPADNFIILDLSSYGSKINSIDVRDLSGRNVQFISANELIANSNGLIQLDVSNYAPGVYLIQLTSNNGERLTKKFVVN